MLFGTLDFKGVFLALLLGYLIALLGGFNYLALMLAFLFFSTVVTYTGEAKKKALGLFEEKRTSSNVFWNGLAPFIFLLFHAPLAFIAATAALLADKFASELGVLEEEAIELFTWKRQKAGKSGCVSLTGLLASFLGAALIAISAVPLFGLRWSQALAVAFLGFFGSLVDSAIGYFEERGLGSKGLTNFLAAFFAGLVPLLIGL